jgi:phage terminase large subunit-like protein
MPAETIAHAPIAQLSGWVREGWLIETAGNEADYGRIRDDLIGFTKTLQVREIDFDRRSARLMMQDVRALLEVTMGRDQVERTVLDIPQSVETMDPAMKMTEALVLGQKLDHDGSPVMAWMITNVVVERNHKGEIYPRKAGGKDSWSKIDCAVAFYTALSRARLIPEPDKQYQFFKVGGKR